MDVFIASMLAFLASGFFGIAGIIACFNGGIYILFSIPLFIGCAVMFYFWTETIKG